MFQISPFVSLKSHSLRFLQLLILTFFIFPSSNSSTLTIHRVNYITKKPKSEASDLHTLFFQKVDFIKDSTDNTDGTQGEETDGDGGNDETDSLFSSKKKTKSLGWQVESQTFWMVPLDSLDDNEARKSLLSGDATSIVNLLHGLSVKSDVQLENERIAKPEKICVSYTPRLKALKDKKDTERASDLFYVPLYQSKQDENKLNIISDKPGDSDFWCPALEIHLKDINDSRYVEVNTDMWFAKHESPVMGTIHKHIPGLHFNKDLKVSLDLDNFTYEAHFLTILDEKGYFDKIIGNLFGEEKAMIVLSPTEQPVIPQDKANEGTVLNDHQNETPINSDHESGDDENTIKPTTPPPTTEMDDENTTPPKEPSDPAKTTPALRVSTPNSPVTTGINLGGDDGLFDLPTTPISDDENSIRGNPFKSERILPPIISNDKSDLDDDPVLRRDEEVPGRVTPLIPSRKDSISSNDSDDPSQSPVPLSPGGKPNTPPNTSGGGLKTWEYGLIFGGGALVIIGIGVLVWALCRKKGGKSEVKV